MTVLHPAKPPIAREALEDSRSRQTIKDLLAARPDAEPLDSPRTAPGEGRDDDTPCLPSEASSGASPRGTSPSRPSSK